MYFCISNLHHTYTAMPEPKIILYKSKEYSDGSHPIMIQIVEKGKPIRKVISRCLEKDWSAKKCRVSAKNIEAPRINNLIEIALREFGIIKEKDLFDFIKMLMSQYEANNQYGRFMAYKALLPQLEEFDHRLTFSSLNERKAYDFVAFLRDVKKNGPTTIREKIMVLKRITRAAKKAKHILENPLEDITLKKVTTYKNKLTSVELMTFAQLSLNGKQAEARDVFMACFYLRGTRIGDVLTLTPENIHGNRIVFTENKTGKLHNIGISPELWEILARWMGKSRSKFIFSFMIHSDNHFDFMYNIKRANAKVYGLLKRASKELDISKNISAHIARHSFSKLANLTLANTSITKNLVGHSTLTAHEQYINEISDDELLDGYAEQVFESLKNGSINNIG